jgi:hypothetical protein
MTDRRSPEFQEIFGQAGWLGQDTGHNLGETGHS